MVAKIISGKSIMGALNYNELKVKQGKAELISSAGFTKDMDKLTFMDKAGQLNNLASLNRRVTTNAVHISLNFDKKDELDENKLTEVAASYMERIGFGNQPYLVYQHFDAAHTHIHIVTTNVQSDSSRISLHNIGKEKSEPARKEIEKEFGLVKADSKKKDQKEFIHPIDVKKAVHGKSETKRSISNIVGMVIRSYKYSSLAELNAILKPFNVIADRGKEGSEMFEKKGLQYRLIDQEGNKIGVPVNASSIYGKPTLTYLEKQFQLNKAIRKPHKSTLVEAIDQVLKKEPKDKDDLSKQLDKKGIQMVIHANDEGRIFGITYVDHRTKCVFKGSDLGKQYSANSIFAIIQKGGNPPKQIPKVVSEKTKNSKENKLEFPKQNLGVGRIISDLTKAESGGYLSPEAALKLKKKKRKRKGPSL